MDPQVCAYLLRPWCAHRPGGFGADGATASTSAPTTARSAAAAARTAQVPEVDLQLGRDVIGWLPEVMPIVQLELRGTKRKFNHHSLFNKLNQTSFIMMS